MDQLSYPDATLMMKKYRRGSGGKRSYAVNKAQSKAMTNIPYARYVPLSERKSEQYKSTLYSVNQKHNGHVPTLDESLHVYRSKTSMPAPGRNADAEMAFVRGLSVRKSRKMRAKSAAFVPQNEKELALSKIYIKPTDLVVQQSKKAKKPPKPNKFESTKKKHLPLFKIKRNSQIQPGSVYIEPRKQKQQLHTVYDIVKPIPRLSRATSIRRSTVRPNSRASLRPSTTGSMRLNARRHYADESFTSQNTTETVDRHNAPLNDSWVTPSEQGSARAGHKSDARSDVTNRSGRSRKKSGTRSVAELFRVSDKPRLRQSPTRPRTVHGLPSSGRRRHAEQQAAQQQPTRPASVNAKAPSSTSKSPYGLFTAATQASRPNTASSTLTRSTVASAGKSKHAQLKESLQSKASDVRKKSASNVKSFKNSIYPLGQIVTKRPLGRQNTLLRQQGRIKKGPTATTAATSVHEPKQPRVRLKWYNILQRTHYEKKVNSMYANGLESRDNTCTEDEILNARRSNNPARPVTEKTSAPKRKSKGIVESKSTASTGAPVKSALDASDKIADGRVTRADSVKSGLTLLDDKHLEVSNYDADLETDVERIDNIDSKAKNTPRMVRRAKARRSLSNNLARTGSTSRDDRPRHLSRFNSLSRSKRDSSRYRAEERKLRMYVDSTTSSATDDDDNEDPILQRMNSPRASFRAGLTLLSPKNVSWLSDDSTLDIKESPVASNPPSTKRLGDTEHKPISKQRSFLKESSQMSSTPDVLIRKGSVKEARTMFEYQPPTPDYGRVVTVQGVSDGQRVIKNPSNDASNAKTSNRMHADATGGGMRARPNGIQISGLHQSVSGQTGDSRTTDQPPTHQPTTNGLTTVENKHSWTPVLTRSSRKEEWNTSKDQHKAHEAPKRNENNTKSLCKNTTLQPSQDRPKKAARPVNSKPQKLSTGIGMFGEKYRRERSNPRTNLVRTTGIYSHNYEACGESSQSQGVTLPKLVSDDDYEAFARTKPGPRAREFSPMNWTRHGVTDVPKPKAVRNSRQKIDQSASSTKNNTPRSKAIKSSDGNVFKQILQSMLENTQGQEDRATTAPEMSSRAKENAYLPAVPSNSTNIAKLNLECTKL